MQPEWGRPGDFCRTGVRCTARIRGLGRPRVGRSSRRTPKRREAPMAQRSWQKSRLLRGHCPLTLPASNEVGLRPGPNGAKRQWHSAAGKSRAFCQRPTESGSARPVPGQNKLESRLRAVLSVPTAKLPFVAFFCCFFEASLGRIRTDTGVLNGRRPGLNSPAFFFCLIFHVCFKTH